VENKIETTTTPVAPMPFDPPNLAGLSLMELERAAIAQTLKQCGGNKMRTAQVLQIALSTLYEKIKKYGL
jgi:two-component system, NtrC family, response regulator